jgi:hypothetical protein
MCLEFEGDFDAAQQEYMRARERLSTSIPLPKLRTNSTNSQEISTQLINSFEEVVRGIIIRVSDNSYQKEMEYINNSMLSLNEPQAKPFEHEEAVRSLGEQLGFQSTRPDNDFGTGPDVLWIDKITKKCIGFELKTGKKNEPTYFKKDIDQGHGNLAWINNDNTLQYLGLIFVGPHGNCAKDANPSPHMYHCELSVIASIKNDLIAGIKDLRKVTPSERLNKVKIFCAEPQWSIDKLFSKLAVRTIHSMK